MAPPTTHSKIKDLPIKAPGDSDDEFVINDVTNGNVDKKLGMDQIRLVSTQVTDFTASVVSSKLDDFTAPDDNTDTDATTSAHGLMPKADKVKLDGIADSANNYSHPNHTGDVTSTGDGATAIDKTAITGQTEKAVPTTGDFLLATDGADTNNLKKVDIGNLPTGGGGEANTSSNVGTGATLAKAKVGVDLPFKSIIAGTGITAVENTNDVTLNHDAHTGDVTGSTALTIGTDKVTTSKILNSNVTYAKIQNVSATDRILGRDSVGAGVIEEITPTALRTMINVEDGATADQSDAEIKTAYENNANTNEFSDAEQTKLAGIATGANLYVHPDHTGDVTSVADGAQTIANNAVTNAKAADVATATIKGRVTAATGDPEDLTGTQATTLLDTFTSGLKGLAPASGGGTTNFLRADGTWIAPGGSGDMVLASAQTNTGIKTFLDTTMKLRNVANTFDGYFVNTNTADRVYTLPDVAGTVSLIANTETLENKTLVAPALGTPASGVLTNCTGLPTAGLVDEAVTYAKMQHMTTDRLLGRDTAATGDVEEISLNSTLEFTGSGGIQRAALTGDITASAGSNATAIAAGVIVNADISATAEIAVSKLADGAAYQRIRTDSVGTGVEWFTEQAGIPFVIDGGGAAITTGIKGDIEVPFDCVVKSVRMLADQSGSIVVDIWKDTYANFPPTDADSITASAVPTITTATKSEDTTLTGWTTTLTKGDVLRWNVDSVTSIQRVTMSLIVDKRG